MTPSLFLDLIILKMSAVPSQFSSCFIQIVFLINLENTDKCSKESKTDFTSQNHFSIVLFYSVILYHCNRLRCNFMSCVFKI